MKIEPVAEITSWTNSSYGRNYKIEWHKNVNEGDKLYTEAQLGEACAAVCDSIAKGRNSVVGTRCADSVRRLIKELLPSAAAELAKQEKS